jgi:hypothetical protein
VTATGLPRNGSTVYVRLWYKVNSKWQYKDYTYTAKKDTASPATVPEITSPQNGSTLTGSTVNFNWNAGTGVTAYWLYAGKSKGTKEYYNSGATNESQVTATGLPRNGSTVYVRLWYKVNGTWHFKDYQYKT